MTSTSPRRSALAALVLAPVLAACGFNAPTDQVYQPAEGVIDRDGDVDVLNALVVSGADGSGTFIATLVNNDVTTADQLSGVTGAGVTVPAEVFAAEDVDLAVPADGLLNLATEGAVTVEGANVRPGGYVELTLTFTNADPVTLRVPVVRADGDYADVPLPSQEPTAEPTDVEPSTDAEPDGEATEGPSQEPTGSPE